MHAENGDAMAPPKKPPPCDAGTSSRDTPLWVSLWQDQASHASEERREQIAAIRELAKGMHEHNQGAAQRHLDLILALRERDHGAEKAIKEIAAEKSVLRRWVEVVAKEFWTSFKVPIAGLITAACAYYAYAHYQIPTTPTPVEVRMAPPVEEPRHVE